MGKSSSLNWFVKIGEVEVTSGRPWHCYGAFRALNGPVEVEVEVDFWGSRACHNNRCTNCNARSFYVKHTHVMRCNLSCIRVHLSIPGSRARRNGCFRNIGCSRIRHLSGR